MAASRARVIRELSRSARASSPREDEYHTGVSEFNPDEAIHSTLQFGNTGSQQWPLTYDQYVDRHSDAGSEGSADMSIELGRGVKRGARDEKEDVSSNAIFTLGDDSQYELAGTPPIKSRGAARKNEGVLRREASVRRAAETAKANEGAKRTTSQAQKGLARLAEATGRNAKHGDEHSWGVDDSVRAPMIVNSKNTRFTRSRQTSAAFPSGQNTPPRNTSGSGNPAVRSATHTANSFMLPDLTDIHELVGGSRKEDATPMANRNNPSNSGSRFTPSADYRMPSRGNPDRDHIQIESAPIPEDEKRIYASLQILQDKVVQLEQEKSAADKRVEDFEVEIIQLRSQLDREEQLRRPDSALGSESESEKEKWRMERTRLQASVMALQQRLERSERKVSMSDVTVKRVTKERDELITRIGVTFYNIEEVKAENEELREDRAKVLEQNGDLMEVVVALREELGKRKAKATVGPKAGKAGKATHASAPTRDVNEAVSRQASQQQQPAAPASRPNAEDDERLSVGDFDEEARDSIAQTVQQQLKRMKDDARLNVRDRARRQRETVRARSHPKSLRQSGAGLDHASSAPSAMMCKSDAEDVESHDSEGPTEIEVTNAREATKGWLTQGASDSHNLTNLTKNLPIESKGLRQALEEQRRAGHLRRHSSAPVAAQCEPTVAQDVTKQHTRKSSLRDITTGLTINGDGRVTLQSNAPVDTILKGAKTVRVLSPPTEHSPHDLDGDEMSIFSNTCRPRCRSANATEEAGETSAFIIPDITLNHPTALPSMVIKSPGIHHIAGACSVCAAANGHDIGAPLPVIPASSRTDLPEDATLRPAQPPHLALVAVLQQLQDEVVHIKLTLAKHETQYHAHDPAIGASKRRKLDEQIRHLRAECERRSGQIYALYDVLEGQKVAVVTDADAGGGDGGEHGDGEGQKLREMNVQELEETLTSIGIGPAEMAGRIGRSAPPLGLDGIEDGFSDEESLAVPDWEGLSDGE